MKISEILTEADNTSIRKILDAQFYIDGTYEIKKGVVNVNGHATFTDSYETRNMKVIPRIPIKFGSVTGDFRCNNMMALISLEGAPDFVGRIFDCSQCKLTNLQFSPMSIGYDLYCYRNPLESFDGISPSIGHSILFSYGDNLPLLKLLTIKKLQYIEMHDKDEDTYQDVIEIINKNVGKGRGGILAAAAELTKAGYKGNARL